MANYDDETRLCLICLSCAKGVGPASIRRLLRAAKDLAVPLKHLIGVASNEPANELGLTNAAARAIAAIEAPVRTGEAILEQLAQIDARPVLEGDVDYPANLSESLGSNAPPVLFLCGAPGILQSRPMAVAGSRQPSKCACEAAAYFASVHSRAGRTVVSGGACGIDTIGHQAALKTGATAVVPAMGIARFHWRGIKPDHLRQGTWCVVGQFRPDGPWSSRYALIRNRTIVGLSEAVVAFEPRDTGGTWHSSLTALRMGKPLFVVSCAERGAKRRGLERLVRLGATVLDPRNMPGPEAFDDLVSGYEPPPRRAQLFLFEAPEDT